MDVQGIERIENLIGRISSSLSCRTPDKLDKVFEFKPGDDESLDFLVQHGGVYRKTGEELRKEFGFIPEDFITIFKEYDQLVKRNQELSRQTWNLRAKSMIWGLVPFFGTAKCRDIIHAIQKAEKDQKIVNDSLQDLETKKSKYVKVRIYFKTNRDNYVALRDCDITRYNDVIFQPFEIETTGNRCFGRFVHEDDLDKKTYTEIPPPEDINLELKLPKLSDLSILEANSGKIEEQLKEIVRPIFSEYLIGGVPEKIGDRISAFFDFPDSIYEIRVVPTSINVQKSQRIIGTGGNYICDEYQQATGFLESPIYMSLAEGECQFNLRFTRVRTREREHCKWDHLGISLNGERTFWDSLSRKIRT